MKENIMLTTKDNHKIAADFYPVRESKTGVIFIHMMPANKESWTAFAASLQAKGMQSVAFDLRGHGRSQKGPAGYEQFSDAEHQASYHDIEAADYLLRSRGAEKIHLVGASIGANLALWYLVDHPEVSSATLLSAGLEYRGIETEPLASRVGKEQAVFFAGSREDERASGHSAAEAAEKLYALCTGKKEIKLFDGAGHGTIMLERNPDFMNALVEWIGKQ